MAGIWAGDLRGATGDCKSADQGSTPSPASIEIHLIPSKSDDELFDAIKHLLPLPDGPNPTDLSWDAQERRRQHPNWIGRQHLVALLHRAKDREGEIERWKSRFAEVSRERSRLLRENERLKRIKVVD